MSRIAYVRQATSQVVHVSLSTERHRTFDVHDATLCGQRIQYGLAWVEAPRPTETGMESDLRRCKKCDRKRVEGVPAFDYEEELAARTSYRNEEV